MDAKGKPNDPSGQVASGYAAGSASHYPARGRGQFIPQSQAHGRGTTYPQCGGRYRGTRQQSGPSAARGLGRGMPTPAWVSGKPGQQPSYGGRGSGSSGGLRGQSGRGARGAVRGGAEGGKRVRRIMARNARGAMCATRFPIGAATSC